MYTVKSGTQPRMMKVRLNSWKGFELHLKKSLISIDISTVRLKISLNENSFVFCKRARMFLWQMQVSFPGKLKWCPAYFQKREREIPFSNFHTSNAFKTSILRICFLLWTCPYILWYSNVRNSLYSKIS